MKNTVKEKIKAIAIRALHTMAQAAAAAIGTAAMLEEVNWLGVLSTALLAGLASVLKSVAVGVPEVREETEEETNSAYDGEEGI